MQQDGIEYLLHTPKGEARAFFPDESDGAQDGDLPPPVQWSGAPHALDYLKNCALKSVVKGGYTANFEQIQPEEMWIFRNPDFGIVVVEPTHEPVFMGGLVEPEKPDPWQGMHKPWE